MTSERNHGRFFQSRRFRAGFVVVLFLAVVFLPPWWSPLRSDGDPGPRVEITVTSDGFDVAVAGGDADAETEVRCVYLFTSEAGEAKSEVMTILSGTTQTVGVTGAYPADTVLTYTISCHVGNEVFLDSGIITVGAEQADG